jgi:hypothetical protein
MPRQRIRSPSGQARSDHNKRLKRFAEQFERLSLGEPVKSYETKWLAYLKERHAVGDRVHNLEPSSRVSCSSVRS